MSEKVEVGCSIAVSVVEGGSQENDGFRAPHCLFRLGFILNFLTAVPSPDGVPVFFFRLRIVVGSTIKGFIYHSMYLVLDVCRHSGTALLTRMFH